MSSYNACWDGGSSVPLKEKEILDRIVAATRAEEDEIKYMLKECDGDVNEAVNRLMDSKFRAIHAPIQSHNGAVEPSLFCTLVRAW